MTRQISILLLIMTLISVVMPTSCYAELNARKEATGELDAGIEATGVADTFKVTLYDMETKLTEHGKSLFIALALVQFAYNMGMLLVRGQMDMQTFTTTLLRQIMLIGIFYFLIDKGADIFEKIIDSFRAAATSSGILAKEITPGGILSTGVDLTRVAKKEAWSYTGFLGELGYGEYIYLSLLCTIMQFAFAVMSVTYMLALIKGYFICTAGMLFLGFGGSEWSSDIAKNTFKSVLSAGAELFVILLIATIATNSISGWLAEIESANDGQAISALISVMGSMAFVIAVLTLTAPGLAAGLINGSAIGAGGTAAVGAMAGAAAMAPFKMMARAGMSKLGNLIGSGAKFAGKAAFRGTIGAATGAVSGAVQSSGGGMKNMLRAAGSGAARGAKNAVSSGIAKDRAGSTSQAIKDISAIRSMLEGKGSSGNSVKP